MRIVLLGSGPFAAPSFEAIIQRHEVPALITRPLHAAKGHKPLSHPTAELAQRTGVPLHEPQDINSPEAQSLLASFGPELLVVCDYGQILSSQTLAVAPLGGINLHGSLLPKYRGAAPVQWAVYHGEAESGVTIIHMTPRLDAGPSLVQKRAVIGPEETAAELEPRLALLGVEAVEEAIVMLAAWDRSSPIGEPQNNRRSTRAPKLSRDSGHVDWTRSAVQISRQVRAFKPWPGTYTFLPRPKGEPMRIILDGVSLLEGFAVEGNVAPGEVITADRRQVVVATGDGALSLDRLQPAGKRVLEVREFLNGHPLHAGDRFQ